MATESQERRLNEAEIRFWAGKGMSQRAIARKLHISRPMVQRVLSESGPSITSGSDDDSPDDLGEVQSEFNEMVRVAKESGGIDDYRRVHKVARTCFENGYAVSYGTLPYLMALSTAQAGEDIDSAAGRQRRKGWSLEIDSVYHFMKFYRLANWARRPPVPVPDDWWEQWVSRSDAHDKAA